MCFFFLSPLVTSVLFFCVNQKNDSLISRLWSLDLSFTLQTARASQFSLVKTRLLIEVTEQAKIRYYLNMHWLLNSWVRGPTCLTCILFKILLKQKLKGSFWYVRKEKQNIWRIWTPTYVRYHYWLQSQHGNSPLWENGRVANSN